MKYHRDVAKTFVISTQSKPECFERNLREYIFKMSLLMGMIHVAASDHSSDTLLEKSLCLAIMKDHREVITCILPYVDPRNMSQHIFAAAKDMNRVHILSMLTKHKDRRP
jgi:hypothetical protein